MGGISNTNDRQILAAEAEAEERGLEQMREQAREQLDFDIFSSILAMQQAEVHDLEDIIRERSWTHHYKILLQQQEEQQERRKEADDIEFEIEAAIIPNGEFER